jgi:hypothetical protein
MMTDTTNIRPHSALGVGAIISDSFSILMRHFLSVVMLAIVPTLIGLVISGLMIGWDVTMGLGEPVLLDAADFIPFGLSIIVQVATYGISTALLVQLAYAAKLDEPLRLGDYVGPAISAALPITILSIAVGLLMVIGLVALIVPGLWIYAVFSVMPAAVVIEKVGFGGLGRSAALTKDYRWPILGAIILMGIITAVITNLAVYLAGLIIASMGSTGLIVGVLAIAALTAVGGGLSSISVALIYARLREIKEGASVRDIAAVFD